MTAQSTISAIREVGSITMLTTETQIRTVDGEHVCTGFSTLVVEFARAHSARSIVKGLRAVSDFEWEFQMNNLNRGLAPEIETLYMMSSPKYSFLSSRGVREIASFGGPVAEYVPEQVARRLADMHAAGAI